MAEAVTTKKRGRPKKSVVEDSVAVEPTESKKARTPGAKTTTRPDPSLDVEAASKRGSRTTRSPKDPVSKTSPEVVASKSSSTPTGSKKAAAASTNTGKISTAVKKDERIESSALGSAEIPSQSAKRSTLATTDATKKASKLSRPLETLKEAVSSSSKAVPNAAASERLSKLSTAELKPETVDLDSTAKKARIDHPAPEQGVVNNKSDYSPVPAAPASKILEALSQTHQQSTLTTTPPPSPVFPPPSTLGPKFSASSPLNSPPPSSMSSSSKSSSQSSSPRGTTSALSSSLSSPLPRAKPHQPLPSGPPNPAQTPVTPQQIETIRQSPAYKAASGRWVRGIVALPVAIVTSWVLWDRYQNGTLPTYPPSSSSPRGGSGGGGGKEGSTPAIPGDANSSTARGSRVSGGRGSGGGAKPRVVENYLPGVGFVVREKRLLDL